MPRIRVPRRRRSRPQHAIEIDDDVLESVRGMMRDMDDKKSPKIDEKMKLGDG